MCNRLQAALGRVVLPAATRLHWGYGQIADRLADRAPVAEAVRVVAWGWLAAIPFPCLGRARATLPGRGSGRRSVRKKRIRGVAAGEFEIAPVTHDEGPIRPRPAGPAGYGSM